MFETTHQLALPQGTIHYRDIGEGPVLLFVHGVLVTGKLWRKVVPRLPGYRCIVPDWPLGSHRQPLNADADLTIHGAAALVADFIAALGLRDVTIIGNDSGGLLSQLVVTRHPEHIARLVLTPCDAFEAFPPPAYKHLTAAGKIPGLAWLGMTLLAGSLRLARSRYGFGPITRDPLPAELLREYLTPAARDGAVRRDLVKLLRDVDPAISVKASNDLANWHGPTLLAWADDRVFPLTLAERLHATLPDSELVVIDNARAFVSEDQPAVLAQHIDAFMQRCLSPKVAATA